MIPQEIKPCPFCNSSKVVFVGFDYNRTVAVWCESCSAYGPKIVADKENSKAEAIRAWNNGARIQMQWAEK